MSNPFLVAKRLGPPKQHPAFRKAKYSELWAMSISELKQLYALTDDKYKKCAITRCINEKTGIKVIKPTERQEIARKLNYLTFVSSGYLKQLNAGISQLQEHKDGRVASAISQAYRVVERLETFLADLQYINKPETGPRKRPSKRGTAWKQADNTGHNHDNQKP